MSYAQKTLYPVSINNKDPVPDACTHQHQIVRNTKHETLLISLIFAFMLWCLGMGALFKYHT
jgi:hypothetical protein